MGAAKKVYHISIKFEQKNWILLMLSERCFYMKALKTLLFVTLLMPLAASMPQITEANEKKRLDQDGNYTSVCVNGNLIYESQHNFLPRGFYGNYPDSGIVEIGGKAGDINGKPIPKLTWSKSGRFMASIQFDKDPHQFITAEYIGKLGFEISVEIPGQGDLIVDNYVNANSFDEIFLKDDDVYVFPANYPSSLISPFMTFWTKSHAALFTFSMYEGYKLNYIRLTYGDCPERIVNASIFEEVLDPIPLINEKYTKNDCSRRDYTANIGSHPVYNLISQYGTIYSKDFLLNSFAFRDEYDGELCHITEIEDPNNYFTYGAKADIGSKFTIYLIARDKANNISKITINFTVLDKRAPTVQAFDNKVKRVSYTSDLNSAEFINRFFIVKDNYDKQLTMSVKLQSGLDVPTDQIGSFPCRLIVSDSFNNISTLDFGLELYDDISPVIESEQDEMVLSPTKTVSETYIKSLFTAYDEIDGELEVEIVNNEYSGHENEIGSHIVEVEAIDSSGNVSTKKMIILVQDNEGPIFYAKESFLTVTQGDVPTLDEITESLIRQALIPNKNYVTKEIIEGENLTNNLSVGLYQMKLHLVADDESEELIMLTVKVIGKEDINVTDQSISFWEAIVLFFINIWNKIVEFFTNS